MIRDTLLLFTGRALNAVFLFLLALAVSRLLGPEAFGLFSFVTAVVTTAAIIAGFGLDLWLVRATASNPPDGPGHLSRVIGLKLALSMGCMLGVAAVFAPAGLPGPTYGLLVLLSLSIPFNAVAQSLWHYGDGHRRFGFHAWLWPGSNFLKASAGVALALVSARLDFLIGGLVLAEAAGCAVSYAVIRRNFGPVVPAWDPAGWRTLLKETAPLGISAVFSTVYFRLGILLLGLLTAPRTVGLFSAGYRLIEVLSLIPQSALTALFPRLVQEVKKGAPKNDGIRKPLQTLAGLGLAASGVLWFGAEGLLTLIFGEAFAEGAAALRILAFLVPLQFVNLLLSQVLISRGRDRQNLNCLMGITAFSLASHLLLIPNWGILGAAWATLISEMVLTVVYAGRVSRWPNRSRENAT